MSTNGEADVVVKVPPSADFSNFSKLLLKQGDHCGALATFASTECDNTKGLDNLLSLIRPTIDDVSARMNGILIHCQNGMGTASSKVVSAREAYSRADAQADARIRATYDKPLPGFHEIAQGPIIGSFEDVDLELKPPAEPADPIKTHLIVIGGPLGAIEHVWRWLTGGDSLLERLVVPITGEYSRLQYLQKAYETLADNIYTVAGNLRRGTWKMAAEWNGDAATAFESYMFRWHMGVGGLGDAAIVTAHRLRDAYWTITALVDAILKKISDLIEHEIEELAEEAGKMMAGDAAIVAAGGGPEDPAADLVALGYSIWRMYRLYKIVRKIITAVSVIESMIKGARKAVEEIVDGFNAIKQALSEVASDPGGSFTDMMNDIRNRGFEFEKNAGWSADLGANRIRMLPAAS